MWIISCICAFAGMRHESNFDADALLPSQCLWLYDVTEAVTAAVSASNA